MRNCPKCGTPTDKAHCQRPTGCGWHACRPCKILFESPEKMIPWYGSTGVK